MEAITITVDDVEVSGYSGMTILDLARESGVYIPTLCHDECLQSIGACRICLVEEKNSKALLASCVTPIRSGMVINTRSPRVMERRKLILEFMLASHPDSCLVCDKGNNCELHNLASEMGIGLLELHKMPQSADILDANPFLERDLSKCILCAKCIRVDQELVIEGVIDYAERGFISRPSTFNGNPLEDSECTFCGTCAAFCPTGALTEKKKPYHGTTTKIIDTICPYCGCGCSIRLEVKDDRLIKVGSVKNSSVNHGALCARGSYGLDFLHSPDRLVTPMVRKNGELYKTDWEETISFTAGELKRITDKYGPDSLAVLGSSKCTNEENYLLQKFTRCVLGTNNIDNGSRLYNPASREGLGYTVGFPCTTSSLSELEQSEVIMVIGANPTVSAPAVGYAIKRAVKNEGAKLILIDPRRTKLARFADIWLKPETGTDVALINGIARIINSEKLYDEEFVTRRTDNFDEYAIDLGAYTPEYIEKITGVTQPEMEFAARTFANATRASIVFGTGITQYAGGTGSVIVLANLAMMTGNIGNRGGGIYALQRENNGQGACDMGSLPDFLPGYCSVADIQARKPFENKWKSVIPGYTGKNAFEVIEQIKAGTIKGMLIMGENPVSSFPNPALIADALSSLEFLAVSDIFATETAKLATVVLPAAAFAEKEGTFTNFEGRVQQIRKAFEPAGKSLPDWQIIQRISESMGYPMGYTSPGQIFREIEEMVPLYRNQSGSKNEPDESEMDDAGGESLGAKRFYQGLFPSGFGRFAPVEFIHRDMANTEQYPLLLITGSVLHQFGSGTRSSRAPRLKAFAPGAWIEICESDASNYGFRDGETARIISNVGETTADIKITRDSKRGILFMPLSFPDSPVNVLFDFKPNNSIKTCAVRLERTE